jgi:putative solute:sodium symporter small subunit
MKQLYRKECQLTLVAFIVTTCLTHLYPIWFLFPGLTEAMLFGFPAHYFLTLVVGWIVLMPLYWLYIHMSEKIDREIERAESASDEDDLAATGTTAPGEAR